MSKSRLPTPEKPTDLQFEGDGKFLASIEATALVPAIIGIVKTKEFKNGTNQYLVYGTFLGHTSKEKPSLGVIKASSNEEALKKAQELLNENLANFEKYRKDGFVPYLI